MTAYSDSVIHGNTRNAIQTAVNSERFSSGGDSSDAETAKDFSYYYPYLYGKKNEKNSGGGSEAFAPPRNDEYYRYSPINDFGAVQTAVKRNSVQTQRNSSFIQTERRNDIPDDIRAVMTESKRLDEQDKKAHSDFYRGELIRGMVIQSARLRNKRFRVVNSYSETAYNHTRTQAYIRAVGIKESQLHRQKYIIAAADTDNSVAIESAELVGGAAGTVIGTGESLRTAVKKTANGIGEIRTAVKNGVRLGTAKDIGKVASAVSGGVKNIASDAGNQLLKTKIDKSKTTDTGTEAIKQGITDLRYADNTRRAILNTARAGVKAGCAVKNMPRETRIQMKKISKASENARKAAQKAGEAIKKIVSSKEGLIVILAVLLILILAVLLAGFVNVAVSAVTSLFSFLVSEDGSKDTSEVIS